MPFDCDALLAGFRSRFRADIQVDFHYSSATHFLSPFSGYSISLSFLLIFNDLYLSFLTIYERADAPLFRAFRLRLLTFMRISMRNNII